MIKAAQDRFISHLEKHLAPLLPPHPIREAYEYAVFPPGKLFRPLLVFMLQKDLMKVDAPNPLLSSDSDLSLLASFLELHHSYTLVHDDLPCMDNDPVRRNKPSTHIRYGEWQALLVGDGLLGASYHLLSKIRSPQANLVFRLAAWALGPKGLIQGQVLDLSGEMTTSFAQCLLTHEYKTARLMQIALVGALLLMPPEDLKSPSPGQSTYYRRGTDLFRLGQAIGLCFQLLDDLKDLTDKNLGDHEKKINPFLNFPGEGTEKLLFLEKQFSFLVKKYQLENLSNFIETYWKDTRNLLNSKADIIFAHIREKSSSKSLAGLEKFISQGHSRAGTVNASS